jgi:glycosyltransferase involved in cell wall biosynthesis
MSKRNICFYSAAFRGGSGWFVYALAQALAETGNHVVLVAPEALPLEREPTDSRIKRIRLPRGATGEGGGLFKIYRAILRILASFVALTQARLKCKEYTITHIDWMSVAILQFLWIRLIGGKVTYIVHDAKPHAWAFPERWRSLELMLLKLSYKIPNRIVTLTAKASQELQSDYGRVNDIQVIPHGAFNSGHISELSGNGNILIFGMLRRNKMILESIQAMDLLAPSLPVKLIIAGAPHAEDMSYWSECEAAIANSRADIQVEAGFVPENRVTELIEQADALLLPYVEFNSQSGVAILGSLSGRLLITTDAGGISELIESGLQPVLVTTPVSPQTIANAIEQFAAMSVEQRRHNATESKNRLDSYLSWNRIADEYWHFILKTEN